MSYEQRIIRLLEADQLRMSVLRTVQELDLPDCLVAAGFVRNLVWDSLFGTKTKLNDIDVIYFYRDDSSKERDLEIEQQLAELRPNLPWSVKNQARMHTKNGDAPYKSSTDAMRYWPEKQTAIGVFLDQNGHLQLRHCFDLSLQFSGYIDHNCVRSEEAFRARVSEKAWLKTWPKLAIQVQ